MQRLNHSQTVSASGSQPNIKTVDASRVPNDSPYGSSSSDDEDAPATTSSRIETAKQTHETYPGGVFHAIYSTVSFYLAVVYFVLWGGSFRKCPFFMSSPHAKAQVYSLCTIFWMWDRPHYRTGSYQTDMLANLRNVAIPGSGIPLSLLVRSKMIAFLFLLFGYPVVCAIAGLRKGGFNLHAATKAYSEQLLMPQDWFSFWRLNCVVASYHSVVTGASGFAMEDKWTFLTSAKAENVPVSPWIDAEAIVVKDKNEEGGMGIHFFKNAVHGGDWIIQPKLSNGPDLAHMLPENAPLSTLRVITASRGGLRSSGGLPGSPRRGDVSALSCVFRAGRAKAETDHNSILFDVDLKTGRILKGTTNMHWYQLGASKIATTPWICFDHSITEHPDTGVPITGNTIPNIEQIRELCEAAHFRLLPDVPFAGWDVALTEEAGMCLLEVNLSCNFFRGAFDQVSYFRIVNDYFEFLDDRRHATCVERS